jgi:hypothetical protein
MAFVKTNKVEQSKDEDFFIAGSGNEDFVICKSPDKLKRLLSALHPDRDVHYISDGDWSLHDLIMQLLKEYRPAELFLTTYAIREFSIRQLIMAMDRKELTAINMLLDYRAKVRTPEVYQLANMNVNKICLMAIHAKITVMRSPKGCVTIVGSTNLTSNPRVEAGVISLNPGVAAFYINNIQKLMNNAEIFA